MCQHSALHDILTAGLEQNLRITITAYHDTAGLLCLIYYTYDTFALAIAG